MSKYHFNHIYNDTVISQFADYGLHIIRSGVRTDKIIVGNAQERISHEVVNVKI